MKNKGGSIASFVIVSFTNMEKPSIFSCFGPLPNGLPAQERES